VCTLDDAAQDYATSTRRVADRCDYLVINVSSPNTPGLRRLQDADFLAEITAVVVAESQGRPVFVKLAPDLEDAAVSEAVAVAEQRGAAGIIATNTTIARPGIDATTRARLGAGGLSGRPLQPRALEVIRLASRATSLPVIGVGGISDLGGVQAALTAGADAVQILSALIYQGPGLPARLNRTLAADMRARGIANMDEYRQALRA